MSRQLVCAAALVLHGLVAQAVASGVRLEIIRSLDLQAIASSREVVGSVSMQGDQLYLLIRDRAPTDRTALIAEVSLAGIVTRWTDLKAPASTIVTTADSTIAVHPSRLGLQLIQLPHTGKMKSIEVAGATAAVASAGDFIARLLRDGNLAIHKWDQSGAGPAKILETAPLFHQPDACASCGRGVSAFAYLLVPLNKRTLAVIHRSTARIRIVDLETGSILTDAAVAAPEIAEGQAKYQKRYSTLRAEAPHAQVPNPAVVVAAASHVSGDLFLLLSPFKAAEGALVMRVRPTGDVQASYRCSYASFQESHGPPEYVATHGSHLYILSSRGWANIYRLPE